LVAGDAIIAGLRLASAPRVRGCAAVGAPNLCVAT